MSATAFDQIPMATRAVRRARGTVLLAEDDDDIREAMAQVLAALGWHVREARHGHALLDAVVRCYFDEVEARPDLIVTDIRMPGFNGLSIMEGLRELGFSTPVLVMSAFGDAETRSRVRRWVAMDFIDKPVEPAKLERALHRLCLPLFS